MYRYYPKEKLIYTNYNSNAINIYKYIKRTISEANCCDISCDCSQLCKDICIPKDFFVSSAWNRLADDAHFDWISAIHAVVKDSCSATINDPTSQNYSVLNLKKYYIIPFSTNTNSLSLKKLILEEATKYLDCDTINDNYKCNDCISNLTILQDSEVPTIQAQDFNINYNNSISVVGNLTPGVLTTGNCEPVTFSLVSGTEVNCTVTVVENEFNIFITDSSQDLSFEYRACCNNGTTCDTANVIGTAI